MARPLPFASLIARLVLLGGLGCGVPGPRPLEYGTELCAHCHMTLADPRFAAELVTRTGKVIPFDDPGCLGSFVAGNGIPAEQIHSLWVSDFVSGALFAVAEAVFLRSEAVHSPMDYHFAALRRGPPPQADSVRAALGGKLLPWDSVVAALRPANRP